MSLEEIVDLQANGQPYASPGQRPGAVRRRDGKRLYIIGLR